MRSQFTSQTGQPALETKGSFDNSAQSTSSPPFETYQERRPTGLIGRLFITWKHLLGLGFGGAFAFVRQSEAKGEGVNLEIWLLRLVLLFVWPFINKNLVDLPFPVQFRRRLEMLGPTYIKLGQILSLREDLLPKSVTDELKGLLDRLPAVPLERLIELVEADLKRPVGTVFLWLDPMPLGSASLAQTHRAMLKDGEVVVVKVLKPGVRYTVERDTILLRLVARILQIVAARYQPVRLIDEFCRYTLREVDLRFEAENAATFAANFEDEQDIRFPHIYREFSGRDVLCMEYFDGLKPDATGVQTLNQQQKERAIRLGVDATIRMIFQDGFFHADLHPGNLIIFNTGQIGFIDLGMVGHFDTEMRRRMLYYFYALVMGNPANAARYLSSLALIDRHSDLAGFRRALEDLYRRWLRTPNFYEFSLARVILESVLLAGRYHIQYPGEVILMVKSLVTVEGVGHVLAPGINVREASQGYIQQIIFNQFNLGRVLRNSILLLPELLEAINRGPLVLNESLQQLEGHLKRPQQDALPALRSTLLAGFCLLAAAILVAAGSPWPLSAGLFLGAVILAIRS